MSRWSYGRSHFAAVMALRGEFTRVRVIAAVSVLAVLIISVVAVLASDDSPVIGTALVQESVTDSGYTGSMVLLNSGDEATVGWTVEFELPEGTRIVSHWNASMEDTGQRYRFRGESHNTRIEPGGIVWFGFTTQGTGTPVDCRTNGEECVPPTDSTPPPTPAGLRVTRTTVSSVGLAWDAVQDDHGFVSYRIHGGPQAPNVGTHLLAGTRSTEIVISGLTPNTSHVFTMSAVDAAGNESYRGSALTVKTAEGADTTRPSAPSSLSARATTPTTVELAWNAAEDNTSVVEYRVYEGADVVAVSTSLSVQITGLAPASTHRYEVAAADEAENESARSDAVSVTLPPAPLASPSIPAPTYAPPAMASATTASATTAPEPTWPPATLISRGLPVTASSAGTNGGRPEFGPERAVDGRLDTRWASVRYVDPSWLRVDLGGSARLARVRLAWDLSCATRYSIETSTDGRIWKSIFATSRGDGGIDDIAVGGAGRYVQIVGHQRCRPDFGYSLQEFEVYGSIDERGPTLDKTPPAPPADLRAEVVAASTAALSWTAALDNVGVSGYDIYHDGNLLRSIEAPATSATLTGLAPNTRYRLTVIARDRAGNASQASNMVAITTAVGGDNRPPGLRGPIRTTSITSTAVALDWDDAIDDGDSIVYDVYSGGAKIGTVKESGVVVSGLAASTEYRFHIKARDSAGNNSLPSNMLVVKSRSNQSSGPPGNIASTTTKAPTPTQPPPGGTQIGNVSVVTTGLDIPWGVTFLPNGHALVGERDTFDIYRVTPAGAKTRIGRVPGVATTGGEGGLLGLAVSPNFATDGLLYAYHTSSSDNRVVRMRVENDRLGAPEVILSGVPRNRFHNGGRIIFGPDNLLYVATGDAQNGNNAQSRTSLGGKILRITPEGRAAAGNPFGNAVFSYGHRNVQGLWFDSRGRLWASEFGENDRDEVNQIRAGSNYGWPICEGSCGRGGFVDPVHEWPVAQASPSGLCIVGDTIFMASLRGTRLWRMEINGSDISNVKAYFVGTYGRLRTIILAPDGSLWMTTSNRDSNGRPRSGDDRILRIELE